MQATPAFRSKATSSEVKTLVRTVFALTCISLSAFSSPESAQAANFTPTVNVPAVNTLYELYTNGIFPLANGKGTEATLQPLKGDNWIVSITNTSKSNWTDFHIEFRGDVGVNAINMEFVQADATNGFGATKGTPLSFSLGNKKTTADIAPPTVKQVVPPNGTLTLSVDTRNAGGLVGAVYHLGIMATDTAPAPVPEPSQTFGLVSLTIMGGAAFVSRHCRNKLNQYFLIKG